MLRYSVALLLANQVIRMANDSSEPNRTVFAEEFKCKIIINNGLKEAFSEEKIKIFACGGKLGLI